MADDHHDAVLVPGTYQLERGVDLLRRRAPTAVGAIRSAWVSGSAVCNVRFRSLV